jgi:hypothetical protein
MSQAQQAVNNPLGTLNDLKAKNSRWWHKAWTHWWQVWDEALDPHTWSQEVLLRDWRKARTEVSLALDLVPVLGDAKGVIEGAVSYDLAGNELNQTERALLWTITNGIALPPQTGRDAPPPALE